MTDNLPSWQELIDSVSGTDSTVTPNVPAYTPASELSDEELKARILAHPKYKATVAQPEGNEFTRGVARGIENTKSLVKEGVPALAKGLANEVEMAFNHAPSFDPTTNLEQYQKETEASAKAHPTKFQSFTDVHGLKDLGGYLAAAGGESVPSLVTSMLSGGVGGAAAKFGASQAMKRAGVTVTKEALDKALMKGVAYGALASSAPQNIPETYLGLLAKGQDRPGLALAIGSVKSALDVATPEMLLGKLLGAKVAEGVANEGARTASDILTNKWVKQLGLSAKEVGHAAGMEFGTEGMQEGLDVLAEHLAGVNPELLTADNFIRVMDNGLRGAIGGGLAGAGVHVAQGAPHIANTIPSVQNKFEELRTKLNPEDTGDTTSPSSTEGVFKEEVVGTAPGAIKEQPKLPLNVSKKSVKSKVTPKPSLKIEDYNPAGALKEDIQSIKEVLPKDKISPRLLAAVQANAQLTDEQVQKIKETGSLASLNSSIVHPVQMDPTVANELESKGVNLESLTNMSVEERAQAKKSLDALEQAKANRKKAGRKAIPKQASLPFEEGIKELKGQRKQLRKVKIDDPSKFQGKDKPKFQRQGLTPKEARQAILDRRQAALTELQNHINQLQTEQLNIVKGFGGQQKFKQISNKAPFKRTPQENKALQDHYNLERQLDEKKALRQKLQNSPIASTEYDPSFNTFNLSDGVEPSNSEESKKFEDAIKDFTVIELAEKLAKEAPTPASKHIAEKVFSKIREMQSDGVRMDLKIVKVGDTVPGPMARPSTQGLSAWNFRDNPGFTVYLAGSQFPTNGMSFEIALHELVHVVTQAVLAIGNRKKTQNTKFLEISKSLFKLQHFLVKRFNNNFNNKTLVPFEEKIRDGLNVLATPDELITYAFSSKEAQDYFESIPYDGGTVFSKFVNIVRNLLGLAPNTKTALTEILRIGSVILDTPVYEIREAASLIGYKYQKQGMTDIYDNIYDGKVVVEEIRQQIEGSPLTPQAQKQHLPIIKELKRILKEVTGTGELVMFDQLQDPEGNPVLGMQFMNLVFMSFDRGLTMARAVNTAYHEVWHMLESRGVFTPKQIHILDQNTALLKHYADKDDYLKTVDFNTLMSTQWGREELRANAFGRYAADKRLGIEPTGLHGLFRTFFNKALNIMDKFRNALKGLGFQSYQDIFDSAIEGKHALENLNQARYSYQMARLQKGADQTQEALNNGRNDQAEENIKKLTEAGKARQKENNKPTNYGNYTRVIRSIYDLANKSPMAAAVYSAVTRRFERSNMYLNGYMSTLEPYLNADKKMRQGVSSLADRISNLKTKAWIAEDGSLRWFENDKEMKISDPAVGKAYMAQQATFKRVLSDSENLLKAQAAEAHPDFLKKDFTLADAQIARDRAKAIRDSSDLVKDEDTYQSLKNIVKRLEDFETMRLNDYFPKMRFGTYGFVVHDKEGNQVALFNLEKGYGNDLYNKVQLKNILDTLKSEYSDTTKYDVFGDGKITNFDNAKPYTMNYNSKTDALNDRLVTHEYLYQLLWSKGANQDVLNNSINSIINDFTGRRFEKRFSESKNIPGYSKDFDRVLHAYMTGAAHFLASQASAKEMSNLKAEIGNLHGETGDLAKTLIEYIDYNSSPQEDLQEIRTLNFLWTMGGNIATALLQIVTLPTMTLGLISEYSPNIIRNAQLISKYFVMGIKLMVRQPKGSFNGPINFSSLIREKDMDIMQQAANQIWARSGKTAGLAVENQGKLKTFETDTNIGKAKEHMDVVSRYLGLPVSMMEQLTRFATLNAAYELISTDKAAAAKAREQLKDNPLFQEMVRNEPGEGNFPILVAQMIMDNAHGVFGKQGRPHIYKGLGGSIFLPFQTYPHYALEAMVRMYGRGPDGKRALATTLGAMFLIGGLMGLPGVDALKELLEALENQITGSEEDWQYSLQKEIIGLTGSPFLAKTLTGGLTRSALGMDVSKRTGLAIPGQEIPLTLLGIRGDATNLIGVEGSMLQNLVDAWNGYNNGDQGLGTSIAAGILPTGANNILKAINYGTEGVSTRNGTQLLTADEVTAQTRLLKAIGIRSDQLATATESSYYNTLIQGKYKVGIDRFRKQVTNIKTDIARAQKKDDQESLNRLYANLHEKMDELRQYVKDNEIRPFPYASFNKTTNVKAQENTREKPSLKGINKAARKEIRAKNDIYEKWLGE